MAAPDSIVLGSVAFIVGIFAASLGWSFFAGLLFVCVAIGVGTVVLPARSRSATRTLFTLAIFIFGFFYYHLFLNFRLTGQHIPFEEQGEFSGVVNTESQPAGDFIRFSTALETPHSGIVDILAPMAQTVRYGDRIQFHGTIEYREPPAHPISFFPRMMILEHGRGSWVKSALFGLKNRLVGQFARVLPHDAAALLAGLTFGETHDFSPELRERMRRSGTTHLVALSGYNILILIRTASRVFRRFARRRTKFFLTTAVIAAFVIMTGAEASVVRAAIMGFLLLLAGEAGRQYDINRAVAITAVLMLVVDPTLLVWNIGFQLSFVSLIGIVYLEPFFARVLKTERHGPGILDWRLHAATTAAAQFAVAPLILRHFGEFSLTSFLANILVLAAVPLTMFLGFLLAGIALILPALGIALGLFVNVLLTYELGVIELFAYFRMPVANLGLTVITIAAYYSILILLSRTARERYTP